MHFSKLFRVKAGKLERVLAWMETLATGRREEAIATFNYENVTREVVTLFEGEDGSYYLIGLNEAREPYRTGDPDVQINQEHAAFKKECLDPISKKGRVLLDLRADE
ncbi:hypothetical protein KJ819_03265 [Patescibacteria group bacterium]|nr:hypothetical protein [Patescibacteria group bacterium]MBU1500683.1 hypothetical protein [Patescibacteria group bacterium]MBU2080764.1 hypothetical protein [Patescibacteria group bacterium]MBU2123869.1 hypothetical protein [Patescibacteria group bacterium]MBU2194840.1 hypothetical protein [Patescibacteria group bacterium]